MPYTVPNGSILEVSFSGRFQEQRFLSLFHYRYEAAAPAPDGVTLINTVNPLINGAAAGKLLKEYAKCLHNSAALEEVVYQWVWPTRRARVSKTPAQLVGEVGDNPAPPNIAMAITKRTDTAGRKGVGTLHMPALADSSYSGGRFTLAGQDLYGALQTAMKSVINIEFGENLIPVIYNRSAPDTSPQISTTFSHDEVRTMHRRTVGLGI